MESAKPESKEHSSGRLAAWLIIAPMAVLPPVAFLLAFCAAVNLIETDGAACRKKNA